MVSVLKQHLRVFNIFKTGKSGSIISYHPQEQQNSSVDCGVFVKWAQRIAEGRPLDFTQEQMVDFRYSLILDVSDGFLSMLSTKPGQPCSPSSTSGVSIMAQSEKKSEKKNKSQLSPSDTDSDFESPKKREKKETSTQKPNKHLPLAQGTTHMPKMLQTQRNQNQYLRVQFQM